MHILSLVTDNSPSWIRGSKENGRRNYFMINLRESMGLGWDQTRDPWICIQTRCQLRYAARYPKRVLWQKLKTLNNPAFHPGLHCLQTLKQPSGTEIHHNLETSTCDPLKNWTTPYLLYQYVWEDPSEYKGLIEVLTSDVILGLPPLHTWTAGLFISARGNRHVRSSNINMPNENMSTWNREPNKVELIVISLKSIHKQDVFVKHYFPGIVVFGFGLVWCLTSQPTAMVMSGRSVYLITQFTYIELGI